MKRRTVMRTGCLGAILLFGAVRSSAQGTGMPFTYQGQLKDAGAAVTELCDFEFRLFDAPADGTQIGPTLLISDIDVVDGLFAVELDFGPGAFDGALRYLEISVGCMAGARGMVTLQPRQVITAAPYALYALDAPGNFGLPFFGQIDRPEDGFAIVNETGRALAGSSPESDAVYGLTEGGVAIHGQCSGAGYAVHGEAFGGETALRGDTSGGKGVHGAAGSGTGVHAESADGVALRAQSFSTAIGAHVTTMLNSAGVFEIIDILGSNTADALRVSNNSGGDVIVARTSGVGRAGLFEIAFDPNNPSAAGANNSNALEAKTDADGSAGHFEISNNNSAADALVAVTDGRGSAGSFETATGGGQVQTPTLRAVNRGDGPAAALQVTQAANADPALRVDNSGASNAALLITDEPTNIEPALRARHEGSGSAALLEIADSFGQTTNNAATALRVKTRGLGAGARIEIENAANNSTALVASTDGPGSAGTFTSGGGSTLNASNTGGGNALLADSGAGSAILASAGTGAAATLTSSGTLFPTLQVENLGDGNVAAFTTSLTSAADAIQVIHQGASGSAGAFEVNGAGNSGAAVFAQNFGAGPGGVFRNYRIFAGPSNNPEPALRAYSNAVGGVAEFELENGASDAIALNVITQSTNAGRAASFTTQPTANTAATLEAIHFGRGGAGAFELQRQDNPADALKALTFGMGKAGSFRIENDDDLFMTNESPAVEGFTLGFGQGGYFEIDRPFTGAASDEGNTGAAAVHGKTNGAGPAALFERVAPTAGVTQTPALKVSSNTRDPVTEIVAGIGVEDAPALLVKHMEDGPAGRFEGGSVGSMNNVLEATANNDGATIFADQNGPGYALAARARGGGLAKLEMDPNDPTGANVDAVSVKATTIAQALRVVQQHQSGKIASFEADTPVAAVDAVQILVNNARHPFFVQQLGVGEAAHFHNGPITFPPQATGNANNCVFISNNHPTGRALVVENFFGSGTNGQGLALQVNGPSEFNFPVLANNGLTVQSGQLCAQNVCAAVKNFHIDHPLDPQNQYLYHSCVESDERKNVYDGVSTLDARGEAVVELPDWFEALNRDFRYQLTAIGAPAPNLYVAREVRDGSFAIAGGKPGMKVSWQVTGVRQDAYALANPLEVEVEKPESERGLYLYPEVFGQPPEMGVHYEAQPRFDEERAPVAALDATAVVPEPCGSAHAGAAPQARGE